MLAAHRRLRLARRADRLARRMSAMAEPTDWWRLFDEFGEFKPIQQPSEFVKLLTIVRSCDAIRV
ncbi:MAG TPA: hypothetical protein VFS23_08065, partial [Vicinamibacterales bacterium]|nr:hypothetical protein [Vicinamibacterales bacterium]